MTLFIFLFFGQALYIGQATLNPILPFILLHKSEWSSLIFVSIQFICIAHLTINIVLKQLYIRIETEFSILFYTKLSWYLSLTTFHNYQAWGDGGKKKYLRWYEEETLRRTRLSRKPHPHLGDIGLEIMSM